MVVQQEQVTYTTVGQGDVRTMISLERYKDTDTDKESAMLSMSVEQGDQVITTVFDEDQTRKILSLFK